MTIQLGDTAPDFTAETTEGTIHFHEWMGESWVLLFSHPKDYTAVCTTELGEVARLKPELDRRGVKAIGLSLDPVQAHRGVTQDLEDTHGCGLNFPLIGDPERKVASLYGMIHPNVNSAATIRAVFVIGPDKKVKFTMACPPSMGRNFGEVLRAIDSLQLSARHGLSTPAGWEPGEDVVISSAVPDEEAKARFPEGWRAPKPYLRYVPQPK